MWYGVLYVWTRVMRGCCPCSSFLIARRSSTQPIPPKKQASLPLLLLCSSYPCFGAARATLDFLVMHPSPAAIEALVVQGLPPPLPGVRLEVPHPFPNGKCRYAYYSFLPMHTYVTHIPVPLNRQAAPAVVACTPAAPSSSRMAGGSGVWGPRTAAWTRCWRWVRALEGLGRLISLPVPTAYAS